LLEKEGVIAMEQGQGESGEGQQFNVEVQSNIDFFADQVSVSHNPLRFVIDFTRTSPRIDGHASSGPRLVMSHNVVLLDPYLALEFIKVLKENVSKYEKKHGKITKPAPLMKLEEEAKKTGKTSKERKQEYFG
jgi:hypothetical protein